MKSRKIILIVCLVVTSVIGFTALQDGIFDDNQPIAVNEFSSEPKTTSIQSQPIPVNEISTEAKTITVGIVDGVGSGDTG